MDGLAYSQALKILIIDNNQTNICTLGELIGEGYLYEIISSQKDALAFIEQDIEEVALVLVNIDMAHCDGMSILRSICNAGITEYIPVVAMADTLSETVMNVAFDLGAVDFFSISKDALSVKKRITNAINLYMNNRLLSIRQTESDNLTGLLNLKGLRRCYQEKVEANPTAKIVVVYCDIKNFKYFNNSFGYDEGNQVLKFWADSMRKYCKPGDLLCRISGDQLVRVFLVEEDEDGDVKAFFDNVIRDLNENFAEKYNNFNINVFAGAYIYDQVSYEKETLDQIIGYARHAQETIKSNAQSGCAIYNSKMWKAQQRKIEINGHIDKALKNGEIYVCFQPQYNHITGELVGAECLSRWNHESLGTLSPAEFIPALEESGNIYKLDMYVWEYACQLMGQWLKEGHRISLSVNISRKDIDYVDIPQTLTEFVERNEIEAAMLRLEITESVYMDESGRIVDLANRLSEMGFSVEMDDFGSGFSSLNMLSSLPVDLLKLDMGFLRESEQTERSGNIINAIVRMARVLDIDVLAEGVETYEQAEFLKSIGCLMAQGFYFSKPLNRADFEKLFVNAPRAQIRDNYDKYQLFNIQELLDRNSSGFFLFNNCMGAAILFEYDGRFLSTVTMNSAFADLWGIPRNELEKQRMNMMANFSEMARSKIHSIILRAVADGFATEEFYIPMSQRYVFITIRHVSTRNNSELCFCEVTDITNERSLEHQVQELQKEKQSQNEYMSTGTMKCENSGRRSIVYVSDSLVQMLGFDSRESFFKKYRNYEDMVCLEEQKAFIEDINSQVKSQDLVKCEYRVRKADDSIIWVYEVGKLIRDENGSEWIYLVISDIDRIKCRQLEMRWYKKKLQALMEIPGTVLYEYDPKEDSMIVSIRAKDGQTHERRAEHYLRDLRDKNWIHRDYVDDYINTIKKVSTTEPYGTVVAKAIFANGEYHTCKFAFSSMIDDLNNVYRVVGRAEALVEREEEDILKNMPVGTFRYEADGRQEFDYISSNLVKMLGFSSEEAFRSKYENSFLKFVFDGDVERVNKEIDSQMEDGNTDYCEYRVITADGSIKWLYDRGTLIVDEDGKRWFYVAVTDMDEYKKELLKRKKEQKD